MKRTYAAKSDDGAILVLTAIVAVVLMVFAAFAIDLGNAYARKRGAQTQADLAALAGAASLPDANAAIADARDYLIANKVLGGENDDLATLTNNDESDGEITVDPLGTGKNSRIRVVTPRAKVDFGLARVVGQNGTTVQGVAEAEIRTPGSVLPFFIPVGCAAPAGEIVVKAGAQGGDGPSSPAEPNFFGPSSNQSTTASISSLDPLVTVPVIAPTTQPNLTVIGDQFANSLTPSEVVMRIGFVQGSTQIGPLDVLASQVRINTRPTLDTITFPVPYEVMALPGRWFVQVQKVSGTGNATKWSTATNSIEAGYVFRVGTDFDPADQCGEKQTGDFGLVDSPRAALVGGSEITQSQSRLDLNIAKGLDHSVSTFTQRPLPPVTQGDNCRISPANAPITGGILDIFANRSSVPNCENIFNGNKVDSATDGLVNGGSLDGGYTGRLNTSDALNRTRAQASCSSGGRWLNDRIVFSGPNSKTINNDTLSCFVENGNVTSLVESSPATYGKSRVSRDIFASPRFFYVPVLHYTVNPPNGFYPIVEWRAVFISDEYGSVDLTDNTNGIKTSTTKVSEISVVYFELDKLPEQVADNGQPSIEYIGGTKLVRLVK